MCYPFYEVPRFQWRSSMMNTGILRAWSPRADMMEAIVGVFRADTDDNEPPAVRRDDGSWLLAGYLPADEMADHLGMTLPEKRDYQTVGGFVLAKLGRLPVTGETIDALRWRFEVVDLDGRRIDKVLASRLPTMRRRRS